MFHLVWHSANCFRLRYSSEAVLFYPYTKLDASAILFLQKWRFQNSNLEKLFIVKHMGISWKFIPVMRAGLFTRDYFIPPMQDFISFKRDCGMAHFSYEHILFFQKLHRDSEDLARQASLVWRVCSSPYEEPQGRHLNASCVLNVCRSEKVPCMYPHQAAMRRWSYKCLIIEKF